MPWVPLDKPSSHAIFSCNKTGMPGTRGRYPGKCSVLLSGKARSRLLRSGRSMPFLALIVSLAITTVGDCFISHALLITARLFSSVRISFRYTKIGAWKEMKENCNEN